MASVAVNAAGRSDPLREGLAKEGRKFADL